MSNGHGGSLPEIKALWETLDIQQYSGWYSYALMFRNQHRRKKGGFPWIRKSSLNAWGAFVKVNGLLHSVGLPKITAAPKAIYAPDIPSDLAATYTPSQFNLTWEDPLFINGAGKIRVWIHPPPIPGIGTPGATINAIVNLGVEALTVAGFWYKGNFYNPYGGIWRFWLDCVNQYGIVSGTSSVEIIIPAVIGRWNNFIWNNRVWG